MWWKKGQRQKKETSSGKEIKSATQENATINDKFEDFDKTCSVMYGAIFPFMGGSVTRIYEPEFCRRFNDTFCKCPKANKKITTSSQYSPQPSKYSDSHINKDKRTLLKKLRVFKKNPFGSRKTRSGIQKSSSEQHIKWHKRHKSVSALDSSGSSDSICSNDNRLHVISEKTLEKVFKKYMLSLQISQSSNEATGESPSEILASTASTQTSRSLLAHNEHDQAVKQQHSVISLKVTETTNKSVQNAPMQQSTNFPQTTLEISKPSAYSPESSTSYASAQSRTSSLQDTKSVQTIKSRGSLIDAKTIQPTNKSTQNAPQEQSAISPLPLNTANKSDQSAPIQQHTKFSQTTIEASKPIGNVPQHKPNKYSSESSYASAQSRTSLLQDSKTAQTKLQGSLIDVKAMQPTNKFTQSAPQEHSAIPVPPLSTANKSDQSTPVQQSTKFSQTAIEASKPIGNVLQDKPNKYSSESSYASAQSRTSSLQDSKSVQALKSQGSLIDVKVMQPTNKSTENAPQELPLNTAYKSDQSASKKPSIKFSQSTLAASKPAENALQHKTNEYSSSDSSYASAQSRTSSLEESVQTIKSRDGLAVEAMPPKNKSDGNVRTPSQQTIKSVDAMIGKSITEKSTEMLIQSIDLNGSVASDPDINKTPGQNSVSLLPVNATETPDQDKHSKQSSISLLPLNTANKSDQNIKINGPLENNLIKVTCPPCTKNCKHTCKKAEKKENKPKKKDSTDKSKKKSGNCYSLFCCCKKKPSAEVVQGQNLNKEEHEKTPVVATEKKKSYNDYNENFMVIDKTQILLDDYCSITVHTKDSDTKLLHVSKTDTRIGRKCTEGTNTESTEFSSLFDILRKCDTLNNISYELIIKAYTSENNKKVCYNEQKHLYNISPCLLSSRMNVFKNTSSDESAITEREPQINIESYSHHKLVQNQTINLEQNKEITQNGNISSNYLENPSNGKQITLNGTPGTLVVNKTSSTGLSGKLITAERASIKNIWLRTNKRLSYTRKFKKGKAKAKSRVETRTIAVNTVTCSMCKIIENSKSQAVMTARSKSSLPSPCPSKIVSQKSSRRLQDLMPNKFQSQQISSTFLSEFLEADLVPSVRQSLSEFGSNQPNMSNMSDELEVLNSGLKASTSTILILPPIPKPKTLNQKLPSYSDHFQSDIYKVANVLGMQTSTFIDSYTQTRSIKSVTQTTQTNNQQHFYHNLQNETVPKLLSGCKKNVKAEKVGPDTRKNKSSQFVSVPKLPFQSMTDSDISYVLANFLNKYLSSKLIPLTSSNRNKTNKNLTVRSTTILETATQTKSSEFLSLIPNIHQNFCRHGESLKPNILGMIQLISESLSSILSISEAKSSNSKLNYSRTDHGDHGKIILRPTKIGSKYDLETTLVSSDTKFETSESFKFDTLKLAEQNEIYLNSIKMESSCFIKDTYAKPAVLQPKLHSRYSIRCTNVSSKENEQIFLHSIKMESSSFIKNKIPININPTRDVLQPKLHSPRYSLTRKDNTVDFKNSFETSMESTRLSKFQTYDCQSSSNSYKQRCPTFATILPATSTLSELKQIKSSGDDEVKEEEVTESSNIQSKATDPSEVQSVMFTQNSKTNGIKFPVGLKVHPQSKNQNKVRAPRSKNYEKMPVKPTSLRKRPFGTLPTETCNNNPSTSKNYRKATVHRTVPPYLFLKSDNSQYSDAHNLNASEKTGALFIGPAQLFLVTANTLSLAASNLQQRRQKRKTAWDLPLFLGD